MNMRKDFWRTNLLTAISLTLSLVFFTSSACAGGGAVNHEMGTIIQLMDGAPVFKNDPDRSGAKATAVILFFKRNRMWDGSFATSPKVLYAELLRTALLPNDVGNDVLRSEDLMKKWAHEFDSTKAVKELLLALSLEEAQKQALNNVATNFIQGCKIEMNELGIPPGAPPRRNGRNARILNQMQNTGADFWGGYWVGVAQGLWTAAAVQVEQILSEKQKRKFDQQIETWRRKHAALLKEEVQTKR